MKAAQAGSPASLAFLSQIHPCNRPWHNCYLHSLGKEKLVTPVSPRHADVMDVERQGRATNTVSLGGAGWYFGDFCKVCSSTKLTAAAAVVELGLECLQRLLPGIHSTVSQFTDLISRRHLLDTFLRSMHLLFCAWLEQREDCMIHILWSHGLIDQPIVVHGYFFFALFGETLLILCDLSWIMTNIC